MRAKTAPGVIISGENLSIIAIQNDQVNSISHEKQVNEESPSLLQAS